jgi:ADP-heptose:LPS heptosyltransferase
MKKVLVIKLRGIGDAVLSTPAIQALKQSDPEVRVTTLMPPPADQVFMHNPWVESIVPWRRGKEVPLLLSLRKARYDCTVNLHANLRSALLGYLSGAKVRVIHDHGGQPFFTTIRIPEATVRKSAVERDLDAVRALGIPVGSGLRPTAFLSDKERIWARDFLNQNDVQGPNIVALAIGASAPSKRWPPERFGMLCAKMPSEQEVRVLLLTTSADVKLMPSFLKECPVQKVIRLHNLTIRQVMALLWASRLFIGNDSGIKHLACALGTPTLTLFGPEDMEEWHPYPPEEGHEVVIKEVPCRGRGCGLLECEHLTCLMDISVEEVLGKVRAMLSRPYHERA